MSPARSYVDTWLNNGKFWPWLVLAACWTATFFLWNSVRVNSEEEMRMNFEYGIRETVIRIEQRMLAYAQVLRGMEGLFNSSDSVEHREFRAYFNSLQLEKNFPGIQGVGFSLLIQASDKEQHIRSVRRETDPSYTIKPEGKRGTYSSIIYLEPFSNRNLRAVGYDMYSEPVRHAAMKLAADSATPVMSGKVTLVQETHEGVQAGFLMFLPIFRQPGGVPPPNERSGKLRGWVYSAFRMDDLMAGLFGERGKDTDIEIFDGHSADQASMMYDSDTVHTRGSKVLFTSTTALPFAGHTWTLVIHSTPEFEARFDTLRPLVTAATGAGAGILLALLTLLLVNSRARALEALRVEAHYKNLMERANDGVLVVNMERRITDANEQACRGFGYTLDELRTMHIEELHPADTRPEVIAQFESLRRTGSARFEVLNIRKDGSLVPNEISERFVSVGGDEYVLKFVRDISERKHAEHEREQLVNELQTALAQVKTLGGLIPICSSCKKIRDDKGYWNVLEAYLIEHSDAQFTHGICPDCRQKLYPSLSARDVHPNP